MAKADDELCPRCARDLSTADTRGRRAHINACTDTPPPGWRGQRWTKASTAKHRKGKH